MTNSDKIVSDVLFEDIDGDFYEDAIFISNSSSDTLAAVQKPVLRVVLSGRFEETFNIPSLLTRPNPRVKMILSDIEMDGSEKELIYLSEDNSRVIALQLSEPNRGVEKFNLLLAEPIDRRVENAFSEKNLGSSKIIEVGHNIILIHPINGITIDSSLVPLDGGWADWSNWTQKCSKMCGNGILTRMRLCTSPSPRNGGNFCSGAGVEVSSCKVRDCLVSECTQYEIFENGSCNPDPNNPPPATGGTGSTGGIGAPPVSGGGPNQPGTCAAGKVWDPFFFKCFQPYPINDIWLTFRETIWGQSGSESDNQSGPRVLVHTYRLSLTHPKAIGMSARETAGEYCRFQGHNDVISYQTATYKAGTGSNSLNAYVLCNIATNGMYFGRGGCMVGNLLVSFNFRNITHPQDQNVTYLKSVICRKNQ